MEFRHKSSWVLLGVVWILASIPPGFSIPPVSRQTDSIPKSGSFLDPDPYPWPESSPELQGLDTEMFERAFQAADAIPNMYGLVVIRKGTLVAERYFHGQTMFRANHLHSASKSFISALVGIALRENFIQNLDQKMMDFFPEYASPLLDPRKYQITLRHLLTMRAGFAWEETVPDLEAYLASPDWVGYALNVPLRYDPGQAFNYSSIQTNLLSAILTKASGLSTKALADKYVYGPLGISFPQWYQDPQGYYLGAHAMYISPRDMARFGYLYLQKGRIGDQQIIPAAWIEESWKPTGRSGWNWASLQNEGYGYQWWMGKLGGSEIFFAAGKGGQFIIVVPELEMVVVTTADGDSWVESGAQNQDILRLVDRYILQAARGRMGDEPFSPSRLTVLKVTNRGLALRENINLVRWEPNIRNTGTAIVKYRIYEAKGDSLILRGEVPAGTREFWHRRVNRTEIYHYAVSAVAADGRESIPAYVQNLTQGPAA
jgi:CubicO group peptidase (beta-lactamase class C family)